MRPPSIVNFERIVLMSIVLTVLNLAITWERILTAFAPYRVGGTFILVAHAVLLGLFLLLVWLVSRRGSAIAKWIYVVIAVVNVAINLSAYPSFFASGLSLASMITIVQDVLAVLSLWLLFQPDASAWFRREGVDQAVDRGDQP